MTGYLFMTQTCPVINQTPVPTGGASPWGQVALLAGREWPGQGPRKAPPTGCPCVVAVVLLGSRLSPRRQPWCVRAGHPRYGNAAACLHLAFPTKTVGFRMQGNPHAALEHPADSSSRNLPLFPQCQVFSLAGKGSESETQHHRGS